MLWVSLCNTRLCFLLLSSAPRSVTGLCKMELSAEERCSCCSQGSTLYCFLLTLKDKRVRNWANYVHILASSRWCLLQGQLWRFDVFLAAHCISASHFCIRKLKCPPGLGWRPCRTARPLQGWQQCVPGPLDCPSVLSLWVWHRVGASLLIAFMMCLGVS